MFAHKTKDKLRNAGPHTRFINTRPNSIYMHSMYNRPKADKCGDSLTCVCACMHTQATYIITGITVTCTFNLTGLPPPPIATVEILNMLILACTHVGRNQTSLGSACQVSIACRDTNSTLRSKGFLCQGVAFILFLPHTQVRCCFFFTSCGFFVTCWFAYVTCTIEIIKNV